MMFQKWKKITVLSKEEKKIEADLNLKIVEKTEELKRKDKKLKEVEDDVTEGEKQNQRLVNVNKESKKAIRDAEIEEERLQKEINVLR